MSEPQASQTTSNATLDELRHSEAANAPTSATVNDSTHRPTSVVTEPSGDEVQLKSMFPDLDSTTIHDCYVLCERNVERTVEFLLGTAQDVSTANNTTNALTQTELDEQLARHLEQEELAAAASWRPQHVPPNAVAPGNTTRTAAGTQNNQNDEINFQEQFNKIAETGKRTFNTIFNKVKEKIKEFEGPAPPQGAQAQQNHYYAPESSTTFSTSPPLVSYQPRTAGPHQATYSAPNTAPPTANQATAQSPDLTAATTSSMSTVTPAPINTPAPVNTSKAAFLEKKSTPLTVTATSHPEEDLTENPFEDRNH
ncbi:hypothetical protein CPB86DRAFT_576262 [Serendipita vermifera]|nr:hypothetical protein CPB86DRAFT_576262 [Serendipita vermifera]